MQTCEEGCNHPNIPSRLHAIGRPVIDNLKSDFMVYMFYKREDLEKGFAQKFQIRVETQSVVSEELNPEGNASDALWNSKTGEYQNEHLVIGFPVNDIRSIRFPDERVRQKDPRNPRMYLPQSPEEDITFEVVHVPVGCMYPHCDIKPITPNNTSISKGLRSIAREKFGAIAQRMVG